MDFLINMRKHAENGKLVVSTADYILNHLDKDIEYFIDTDDMEGYVAAEELKAELLRIKGSNQVVRAYMVIYSTDYGHLFVGKEALPFFTKQQAHKALFEAVGKHPKLKNVLLIDRDGEPETYGASLALTLEEVFHKLRN